MRGFLRQRAASAHRFLTAVTVAAIGLGGFVTAAPAASAATPQVASVPAASVPAASVPLTSLTPTVPVTEGPVAKAPSAGAAQQADADAQVARAKVDALLQQYQDAELRVDGGVRALSAAFTAADDAEVDGQQAAAQARRARVRQAQQVRAVYATGGPAALTASILGSATPQDALWRISTADRVLADLFTDAQDQVTSQAGLALLARRRAADADAATSAQADALQSLQKSAADAAAALGRAQQTLATLDTRARNAKAALASAREIAAAQAIAAAARRQAMGPVTALGIPDDFLKDYRSAATTCPGMRWTLLAAVGQVESGHGRNDGPSSAGAIGPMQFEPATFARYAVDGDKDGVLDPWNPADAIFTAAHYLCVAGANGGSAAGVHTALLAYNHAEWYVDLVLGTEQAIIAKQESLDAP